MLKMDSSLISIPKMYTVMYISNNYKVAGFDILHNFAVNDTSQERKLKPHPGNGYFVGIGFLQSQVLYFKGVRSGFIQFLLYLFFFFFVCLFVCFFFFIFPHSLEYIGNTRNLIFFS